MLCPTARDMRTTAVQPVLDNGLIFPAERRDAMYGGCHGGTVKHRVSVYEDP